MQRPRIFRLAVAAFLFTVSTAPCYAEERLAIPEFFGFYSVEAGRTTAIYEGRGSEDPRKLRAELYSIPQAGLLSSILPQISSSARFILYYSNAGEMVQSMTLHRIPQVRNIIEVPDINQRMYGQRPRVVATLNKPVLARIPELEYRLLAKPVSNQLQMVEIVPSAPLTPGLYIVDYNPRGTEGWLAIFAVTSTSVVEKTFCIDLSLPGGNLGRFERSNSELAASAPLLLTSRYKDCDSSSASVAPAPAVTGSAQQNEDVEHGSARTGTVPAASCGDYDACLRAGVDALKSSNWLQALANLQSAANQKPTAGDPWAWLGLTDLAVGQQGEVPTVWNRALGLGAPLAIPVCRQKTMQPCEQGTLTLSAKTVSFSGPGDQKLFAADLTKVTIKRARGSKRVAFDLQIEGKKYNFDFIPLGVTCQIQLFVQCPADGLTQQVTVANYISEIVPKLASGDLTLILSSGPAQTPGSSTHADTCSQAIDLGYSLLYQGRLYKARGMGTAPPNQVHLFFDDKGVQIVEESVLRTLATAAWTRDNVVVSPDARAGVARVSAILSTSKALQNYSATQDLLARSMAEAVLAAATGGSSLTKVIPRLTIQVARAQLLDAPKTVLALSAQRGLESSLDLYRGIEAEPLPPVDSTVLSASDLVKIKDLYVQARSLELPFGALAAKLMPTSAGQLTTQALRSAFTEILGPVFLGSNPTETLTLQRLLDLQKNLANASVTQTALQGYLQNLNLALKLAEANDRTISEWATAGTRACGQLTTEGK